MLKTRIMTAVLLLAALLPSLFFLNPLYLSGIFLLILALAAWEWSRLVAPQKEVFAWLYALLLIFAIAALLYGQNPIIEFGILLSASFFWLIVAPIFLWCSLRLPVAKWPLTFALLGLVIFSAAWFALILLRQFGVLFLLSTMALVWVADIGAYFVGKAVGRRRLAPQISPGKTLEGAIGGILLTCIYACICAWYLPFNMTLFGFAVMRFGYPAMLIMVIGLTLFSIVGDLFESQLKRLAGTKDSSKLLPGHGGVLDRVDALLPTMPLAALLVGLML